MVYIQKHSEIGIPHHFDAACAMYGAVDAGQDFRLVDFESVQSGKMDSLIRSNLFVGSVEFMREVFKRIGKSPKIPCNSNRPFKLMTVKEVRELIEAGTIIFVKPIQIKLFTGFVADSLTIQSLNSFDETLEVLTYDVFEFPIASEWRIYVHNNNIVDARNYSGDFTITPNFIWIKRLVPECKLNGFPCAYTIDVAVLDRFDDEETVVVEFNDMVAVGNYGMDNLMYYRLLKDRYFEIIKGE